MQRFNSKWLEVSGCWEWQGCRNSDGYGSFRFGGKAMLAHRFSYEHHTAEIPKGMHILHHCDNPCCVNPDHLFVGTHSDNMKDMYAKGRHKKVRLFGEAHPSTSLSEGEVIGMRKMYNETPMKMKDIASHFGIKSGTVQAICAGNSWKQLPILPPHPSRKKKSRNFK